MSIAEFYLGERNLVKDYLIIRSQDEIDLFLADWDYRNLKPNRLARVRRSLISTSLQTEMLEEEVKLTKEATLIWPTRIDDFTHKPEFSVIFREADITLLHGTKDDLQEVNYGGINKRYFVHTSTEELLVSICAPEGSDPKEWTVNALNEFMAGTFPNIEML